MADEKTLKIRITTSADTSAIAALKAELASLTDKTVNVTINRRAVGDLNAMARAGDGAARSMDGLDRAGNRAARSAEDHARAAERAGRAHTVYAAEAGRAATSVGRLADATERARAGAREMEPAGRSIRQVGVEAATTAGAATVMAGGLQRAGVVLDSVGAAADATTPTLERAGRGIDRVGDSARRAGRAVGDFAEWERELGRSGGGGVPPIDDLGAALGGFGDNADRAARSADRAASGMRFAGRGGLATVAAYGAAGMGIVGLAAGAATAAVGLGAVALVAAKSQPIMAGLRQTSRAFFDEIRDAAGPAARAAEPFWSGLKTASKGLGREVGEAGVALIPRVMREVEATTNVAAASLDKLGGAMDASIGAAGALARGLIGGLGDAAPQIESMSNAIALAGPSIRTLTRAAVVEGTELVEGVAVAADVAGTAAQGNGIAGGLDKVAHRYAPGFAKDVDDFDRSMGVKRNEQGNLVADQSTTPGKIWSAVGAVGTSAGHLIEDALTPGALTAPGNVARRAADRAEVARTTEALWGKPEGEQPALTGAPVTPTGGVGSLGFSRQLGGPMAFSPGQAAQIAELNQLAGGYQNVNQAAGQAGVGQQQFAQQTQQSVGQAGQAAQRITPQVAQPLQEMAAPPPPPAPAAPPPPPPEMAQPVQQMVRKTVQAAQPEAEQAGQDIGASIGSGAGAGITKTEDVPVTIIRRLIKRVIEVATGSDGLDAHSPSRVFVNLGATVPQGLAVGINSGMAAPVAAVSNMTTQMASTAGTQLAASGGQAGQQLANRFGQQLGQQLGQGNIGQQLGQQLGPNAFDAGLSQYLPGATSQLAQYRSQLDDTTVAQQEAAQAGAGGAGDSKRFPWMDPRTRKDVEERFAAHNLEAQQRKELRDLNKAIATGRDAAGNPMDADRAWEVRKDIMMRYDQPDLYKQFGDHVKNKPTPLGPERLLFGEAGREAGEAAGEGMREGMDSKRGEVGKASEQMAGEADERAKKRLLVNSPSKVFAQTGADAGAGLAGGMANAISGASSAIRGVASDRGLQVGQTWARSMQSGIESVVNRADFQGVAVPNIDSPQAKAALGRLRLLGEAGSGAQVWKTPMVTLGSGSSAAPVVNSITKVYLDSREIAHIADHRIDVNNETLLNLLAQQ